MRVARRGVGVGMLVCASAVLAETPVDLHYTVSLGPVDLADFRAAFVDIDGLQSVQVQFATRGVASWWSEAEGSLEVMALPNAMRTLSGFGQWGDYASQVDVLWPSADRQPQVELIRSRPSKYALTPVPEDSTAGTVDPFAPVFALSRQLGLGQACDGLFRVFDGIRRYNVRVTDRQQQAIQDDPPFFSGMSRVCDVSVERIGGFSERRGLFRFGEEEISRRLYFSEIDGRWWPVRFELTSPLGDAVARLRTAFDAAAQSD